MAAVQPSDFAHPQVQAACSSSFFLQEGSLVRRGWRVWGKQLPTRESGSSRDRSPGGGERLRGLPAERRQWVRSPNSVSVGAAAGPPSRIPSKRGSGDRAQCEQRRGEDKSLRPRSPWPSKIHRCPLTQGDNDYQCPNKNHSPPSKAGTPHPPISS